MRNHSPLDQNLNQKLLLFALVNHEFWLMCFGFLAQGRTQANIYYITECCDIRCKLRQHMRAEKSRR